MKVKRQPGEVTRSKRDESLGRARRHVEAARPTNSKVEQDLRASIERRRAVAEGLRDLLAVVNSGSSLDEILHEVVVQAKSLLASDASSILLHLPSDNETLATRSAAGMEEELTHARLPVRQSAVGLAVTLKRPVVVNDVIGAHDAGLKAGSDAPEFETRASHVRVLSLPPLETPAMSELVQQFAASYRGFLAVPLSAKDQVYGALRLSYRNSREFTDDEVALAMAFADQAALAIENARLYERAAEQTRELQSLLGVSRALTSTLDMTQLVRIVLEKLQEVIDYKAASLILIEGADLLISDLVLVGEHHEASSAAAVRVPRARGNTWISENHPASLAYPCVHVAAFPRFWDLMNTGQPLIVEDALTSTDEFAESYRSVKQERLPEADFMRSWMAVPLVLRGSVIGYIGMSSDRPGYFTDKHGSIARAFADHASVAIENARLFQQAQQAAALEERQRLARELHDAVTQTLFSTSLIAEVVPELWLRKPDLARQRLEDLRRLTRGALAEMRTLLVELRPGALTELPLSDLLRQLSEATAGRTTLEVTLAIEPEGSIGLPSEVQVALYRIAQESLNNIVRHAQASSVTMTLSYDAAGGVSLCITDDGVGFDPTSIPGGHLGVGIMRERAQAIGAEIRLDSKSGNGTTIEVSWAGTKGDDS